MTVSDKVVGTCAEMCPDAEVAFRNSNHLIHPMELCSSSFAALDKRTKPAGARERMVKEYTRSAAGSCHLHPAMLRPPPVLRRTIAYLLEQYRQSERPFALVYSFVSDRLRAVRQDMIMQRLSAEDTVQLLEMMIPFYIETEYTCSAAPPTHKLLTVNRRGCPSYDWKLHLTQLEECFSRWSECFDQVSDRDPCIACAYLLRQAAESSTLATYYRWKRDGLIHDAAVPRIILAYKAGNYCSFFKHLSQLPRLLQCSLAPLVPRMRARAIDTIARAYKSPPVKIPVDKMSLWLSLESESLRSCLSDYGLEWEDVVRPSALSAGNVDTEQPHWMLLATLMDKVVMISDVAWIPRGIAKETPDKIKLDHDQLDELLKGMEGEMAHESSDDSASDDEELREKKQMLGEVMEGVSELLAKKKAKKDAEANMDDDEEEGVDKYMKDFDEDGAQKGPSMKGLSVYANPLEDPYMTKAVDSDEEEEADDYKIRADDNYVAVAKIDKEEYTLEVHVFNEENDDWYVHHDYILEAPPLCLEPINYDPGRDDGKKGCLVGVGTMESVINIWDLDVVNAIEPVVSLGAAEKQGAKKSSGGKSRKKRDGSAQGHSDAVLSLSWNRLTEHVLASGGADRQVILWDLDQAKPAQVIPDFDAEIQSLQWHPVEPTILMGGTMAGSVQVVDCRNVDVQAAASWSFEGAQVEKILWDHFNPFCAFVATDDGQLHYIDMRRPGETKFSGHAHDGGVSGLGMSCNTKGLLATTGLDQLLCVWKVTDGTIHKVHSENMNLGQLHSLGFSPDAGTVCTVGGETNDMIRVFDLSTLEPVVQAFQ